MFSDPVIPLLGIHPRERIDPNEGKNCMQEGAYCNVIYNSKIITIQMFYIYKPSLSAKWNTGSH